MLIRESIIICNGKEEITRYNENGDILYKKSFSGEIEEWKYDEKYREISYHSSNGDFRHKEYDNRGNLVFFVENDIKVWRKYDERGNLVETKSDKGKCSWEFDEEGNCISYKSYKGVELRAVYNYYSK